MTGDTDPLEIDPTRVRYDLRDCRCITKHDRVGDPPPATEDEWTTGGLPPLWLMLAIVVGSIIVIAEIAAAFANGP